MKLLKIKKQIKDISHCIGSEFVGLFVCLSTHMNDKLTIDLTPLGGHEFSRKL